MLLKDARNTAFGAFGRGWVAVSRVPPEERRRS